MIFSVDELRRLLDSALEQVDVPEDCGAVLEGSIAVGFGNSSSDIDFLLIDDSDREHVTMPTILFIEGRRVEVRMRSVRQLARQFEELRAGAAGPRPYTISEDLLNRCQRLSCAVPLRRPALVAEVRAALTD